MRHRCVCGLEDVGAAPAPQATAYDGENWYYGTPRLEAPRAVTAAGGVVPHAAVAASDESAAGEGLRTVSLQYAFPFPRKLGPLLARLGAADVAEACGGRVVELKFVGGPGTALLGVNAGGPVVCANALWRLASGEQGRVLGTLERALLEVGEGRPHLGKLHAPRPEMRRRRRPEGQPQQPQQGTCDDPQPPPRPPPPWPELEEFEALAARYDRDGRFGFVERFH